uniref:CUB domain-containing protein n=1 Tax=Panagrolaimus sp. ES5 TaxID=591445 RepID=A0AC34FMR5_9BILA
MQIVLTKDRNDTLKRLEFQAYVTIVKKEFPNTDAECSNVTTDYNTVWTMDQKMGYGKNVNCSYLLVVEPNTEVFVDVNKVVFEKGVDYIRYYPEDLPRNYTTIGAPIEFIIEPDENGKEKRLVWEFVTDGSIQSSGFDVSFTQLPCVCRNATIDCETPDFNVMNFTDNYYCGNLNCNFAITKCATAEMIKIIFEPQSFGSNDELYDVFTVYSNNEVVLQIDYTNRYIGKFPVYLNSANNNSFEVVANLSTTVKLIKINVKPFTQPTFSNVTTLSAVKSNVIIDTSADKEILFQIGKGTASETFVVYSTLSQGGPLYNNESLSLKLFGEKW